jgi:hypothetical protein
VKKYVFVILLLFLFISYVNAESPTDKGVYSLSGSVSYSHKEIDNAPNICTFSLSPEFVYFVYPNIAIGSSILYSESERGSLETTEYGIGPVARYYFGKGTVYPFISVEYLFINSETKAGASSMEYDRKELALGFGIDSFLSKNVALEPMIRYIFRDLDYYTTSTIHRDEAEFLIGIGITVFIF